MGDTFWKRLALGACRLHQQSDWSACAGADWPDRIMDLVTPDRFHAKQGRTIARWIAVRDDQRLAVYLKRHYRLPWWRGLLASLWPSAGWSPAVQEWRHLEWARRHGMPVPRAVAAAEYIGPWGKLQSVLAVEELAGMLPLHEAIPLAADRLDPGAFRQWKTGLATEMARLTWGLHQRRFFHKDLYLCHFYVPEAMTYEAEVWRDRVHLIDLHRLKRHRLTWRWWQVKDLGQLLYSSEIPGVNARDRLRFWHSYSGDSHRGQPIHWLRRLVIARWRGYRRHRHRHGARPTAP